MPEPGLPESFNVLMHELKGLGLDIRLEENSISVQYLVISDRNT
jgi:DNA-directed RNA polymerase beta subunit